MSVALHPADAFTADRRPLFPTSMRDLPPSVIREASFAVQIGGRIKDRREAHETAVPGCEGNRCAMDKEKDPVSGDETGSLKAHTISTDQSQESESYE